MQNAQDLSHEAHKKSGKWRHNSPLQRKQIFWADRTERGRTAEGETNIRQVRSWASRYQFKVWKGENHTKYGVSTSKSSKLLATMEKIPFYRSLYMYSNYSRIFLFWTEFRSVFEVNSHQRPRALYICCSTMYMTEKCSYISIMHLWKQNRYALQVMTLPNTTTSISKTILTINEQTY